MYIGDEVQYHTNPIFIGWSVNNKFVIYCHKNDHFLRYYRNRKADVHDGVYWEKI